MVGNLGIPGTVVWGRPAGPSLMGPERSERLGSSPWESNGSKQTAKEFRRATEPVEPQLPSTEPGFLGEVGDDHVIDV